MAKTTMFATMITIITKVNTGWTTTECAQLHSWQLRVLLLSDIGFEKFDTLEIVSLTEWSVRSDDKSFVRKLMEVFDGLSGGFFTRLV